MNKENSIEQGNRLIAEFMGRKFKAWKGNSSYNIEFDTYAECLKWIETNDNTQGYHPEIGWEQGMGEYHSSWDWLMPSWVKLKTAIDEGGYMKRNFYFYGQWYSEVCGAIINGDIKKAHELIVSGIEAYNELSK